MNKRAKGSDAKDLEWKIQIIPCNYKINYYTTTNDRKHSTRADRNLFTFISCFYIMDNTQTQVELQSMYENFLNTLKQYDLLPDETKEEMRDDQTNQLLELEIFDQRHGDGHKVKALLSFGWPNEWVTWDDRYNGATYHVSRWFERFEKWITDDQLDTFISMYDIYID